MNILPVDRALSIYGALADRSETKGARERLSKHPRRSPHLQPLQNRSPALTLSRACRPYATPSSNSSFNHRLSDVRTAKGESSKSNGVNKTAKVVLGRELNLPGGRLA